MKYNCTVCGAGCYSADTTKTICAECEKDKNLVEVVRCKDCIHKLKNEHDDDYYCETMWIDFMVNGLTDNDYCSNGKGGHADG